MGILSLLLRLAGKWFVEEHRTDLAAAVGPQDFAMASAGAEKLSSLVLAFLRAHPDACVVTWDRKIGLGVVSGYGYL